MTRCMVRKILAAFIILGAIACSKVPDTLPLGTVPKGLDAKSLVTPANNPLTPEKVELGRILYFDPRLSADGTVSCATCHDPKKGWTDQEVVSEGIRQQKGTRNAPTVVNSALMTVQFWDGRAATLEEQALGPLVNPVEMGNKTHEDVVQRVKSIKGYEPLFMKVFGTAPTKDNISQAIAAFERTILSGNSRYDRFLAGDKKAMNESEVRGMTIFLSKGKCVQCHSAPTFSDNQFHNLGVGMNKPNPDVGRAAISKNKKDTGAFKTPTVRDITKHAPYMHDGSQATLEEVIEFYDKGGEKNPYLDVRMTPLNLTPEEKSDLIHFLKALDGDPYPVVQAPPLPK